MLKIPKYYHNFRLGFALSNRPHFNSTYLLRVPFSSSIAVSASNSAESGQISLNFYVNDCQTVSAIGPQKNTISIWGK